MGTSTTSRHLSELLEVQSTVRHKGQLTVPTDVRAALNLREGDRVAFIVDKSKKVEIVKKQSVVARTAGVLKSLRPLLTAEQLRTEAERALAEDAIQRAP